MDNVDNPSGASLSAYIQGLINKEAVISGIVRQIYQHAAVEKR